MSIFSDPVRWSEGIVGTSFRFWVGIFFILFVVFWSFYFSGIRSDLVVLGGFSFVLLLGLKQLLKKHKHLEKVYAEEKRYRDLSISKDN